MIKVPDLNRLIDERSEGLWYELNSTFNVSLEFHAHPYYAIYKIDKDVTFYIPENRYEKNYFAHEILHVYLASKGINIGNYLILRVQQNPILSSVISPSLLNHISNTLDHVKTFPLYMELGFARNKFLLDYEVSKCTYQEINNISHLHKSSSKDWKSFVDQYLAKFFAIKSCTNTKIDYGTQLTRLQAIDGSLFTILDKFCNQWINFDITRYHPADYNYWDICDEFYNSIFDWVLDNYR
jgi:hypothetical protein